MTLVSGSLPLTVIMGLILAGSASPQTPPPDESKSTQEILKALDQVVEQNKKLEQQNRELMEQVNVLRQRLAAPSGALQPQGAQPVSAQPDSPAGLTTSSRAGYGRRQRRARRNPG